MDKQNRLTRKDEWEIGATYQWLKGGSPGTKYICTAINKDTITLGSIEFSSKQWPKRFQKILSVQKTRELQEKLPHLLRHMADVIERNLKEPPPA